MSRALSLARSLVKSWLRILRLAICQLAAWQIQQAFGWLPSAAGVSDGLLFPGWGNARGHFMT
jgi:hypothetical protein